MTRSVSQEVLLGFVEEAKGYLPRILESLEVTRRDPGNAAALGEAHRLTHNIKGAASMIGFAVLGHIAGRAEALLEQIASGERKLAEGAGRVLARTVTLIGLYLEGIGSGEAADAPILAEVVRSFRRFENEPQEGDAAEVASLLTSLGATLVIADDAPPAEADLAATSGAGSATVPTTATPSAPMPSVEKPSGSRTITTVPDDLLEVFRAEVEEHLTTIAKLLRELAGDPERRDLLREVRRGVHSVKGAAAMMGLAEAASFAHSMEDLLDLLFEGQLELNTGRIELLTAATDTLAELLAEQSVDAAAAPARGAIERRLATEIAAASPPPSPLLPAPPMARAPRFRPATTGAKRQDLPRAGGSADPSSDGGSIRLPMARLDDLMRLVGELAVNRSTGDSVLDQLSADLEELKLSVERLTRSSLRLGGDPRQPAEGGAMPPSGEPLPRFLPSTSGGSASDFDELEMDRYTEVSLLARDLAETASDLVALENGIASARDELLGCSNLQQRLTGEVEDRLMDLRMAPFSILSERLRRTVRTAVRQSGKLAELVIEGEETHLDKAVAEKLTDSLIHLLRNAVDHGIESPRRRREAGKDERGTIRLRAFAEGVNVVLRLTDDGSGLDFARIRETAVRNGHLDPESTVTDGPALTSLLFSPGFTTADEVSELSGRGIGLDVVETTIAALSGTISVDSAPGAGTTFTIRIPTTLALTRVLFVNAGRESFAVPIASITNTHRAQGSRLAEIEERGTMEIEGRTLPAFRLSRLLGLPSEEHGERLPLLTVRMDEEEAVLMVDRIGEAREVVYKGLGGFLGRIQGVSGATLTGDGQVVLIVDPADLIRASRAGIPTSAPVRIPTASPQPTLSVLIVDDSVAVRRLLSGLVRGQGWTATTARDGQEALETLRAASQLPDILLLDLEMPRMDGYELTALLRSEARYRTLPILVLTSRASDKHRRRAHELGVNDYLVKPYQDEVLLGAVHRLARDQPATAVAAAPGPGPVRPRPMALGG